MADLPSGTVTFLFTDIEGSTRLWEEYPEAMREALARHDEMLREAIEAQRWSRGEEHGRRFHAGVLDRGRGGVGRGRRAAGVGGGDVGRDGDAARADGPAHRGGDRCVMATTSVRR